MSNESVMDLLEYLNMPNDRVIVITKGAIEDYATMCICGQLDGLLDGICDQLRYDDSEWDKAINFVIDYIGDAIKELEDDKECPTFH